MKKSILLVFGLLLFTTATFSQNVITLFNGANNFFDLMQQEKYTEAYSIFDESVKSKLSEENLKKIWTDINASLGKAESLEAVQSKAQGDFFAVTVEGKFQRGSQNFILGFNKTQKIVGFFLAPKPNVSKYLAPSYADTTLYSEKSTYVTAPGHQLAAVITTPKNAKNFPVVVFVHGSGPSDMDETVGPNKPFKDLAAGLAAQGIGSVRYVKRTLVYPYEFGKTFTVKEEVLDDAVAAIALAKTIQGADIKNIYLFGHSLGGMLAPRIATLVPDLSGIVLAAAPARKLADLMLEQNKYLFDKANDTAKAAKTQLELATVEIAKGKVTQLGTMKPDSIILGIPASYWIDINNYDQVAAMKKITKPRIFVIQGGNDYQVTQQDYDLWKAGLAGNSNAEFKFYPELNHLLSQQVEKGTGAQYMAFSSVSASLINDIVAWIKIK
ncbi:alpha/beta fold hydrolase [Pedobacter jamesrossensis]|uniref:Alpha/beta fold hydrolase n=1 Tax=Pedobacter jamesrossensis TaxID=1908238 RepID=A0ABV8NLV4_9SPHI